jgi:predicted phosphodiesterase
MRILHSADIHIGMQFASYGEYAPSLGEARFTVLEKLVATAAEQACDLFVIAGDLFDRTGVPAAVIDRTAAILERCHCPVAVLPGNHDYFAASGELWERFARKCRQDSVMLLDEARPWSLDGFGLDAVLYPAICDRKHSESHRLDWISREQRSGQGMAIGIAHGDLVELRYAGEGPARYYPMRQAELEACGFDLWLLGHNHNPWPEKPGARDRVYYAGTPEPDGFDRRHRGSAWLIECLPGQAPVAGLLQTGVYRFLRETVSVADGSALETLGTRFAADDPGHLLLELVLTGRLSADEIELAGEWEAALRERLYYLEVDRRGLLRRLEASDIDREFDEASFAHRLLSRLAAEKDEEALARAHALLTGGGS